jgi:hypothetical protein
MTEPSNPRPVSPRRLWALFEPVHAVTYFAPQPRQAFEAVGLRGFWRGYFAGRSAVLGAVGAAPVTALFYGFAPGMVARALPAVWSLAAPDVVLAARRDGARAALAALDPGLDGETLPQVAELARAAAQAADVGGRALAAANAALPWPEDPLDVLWQAATVLREHRGDGHVAALLTSGVSGLEALVLRAAGDLSRSVLQQARGWSDAAWDAAAAGLRGRRLLDDAGRQTGAGRALLHDVETVTDHLAAQPWNAHGVDAAARFAELIRPLSRAAAAALPRETPIGLPDAAEV